MKLRSIGKSRFTTEILPMQTDSNRKALQERFLSLWTVILVAGTVAVTNAKASQWSASNFSPLAPALFYNWDDSSLPAIPDLSFTSYPNDYGGEAPVPMREAGLAPLALENVSSVSGYSVPQISFNPPVQAVGGYPFPLDSSENTITETVYDQHSNILDSASVTVFEGESPVFLGLGETTTNIYMVRWQFSTAGFIGVANIVYQPGPSLVLSKIVSSPTNLSFQFPSLAGHSNTVQTSTNLASGAWTTFTNFVGNGTMQKITVPTTNAPAGFFRLQAQ